MTSVKFLAAVTDFKAGDKIDQRKDNSLIPAVGKHYVDS